jgi:nicotinamide riboside kinase
MLVNFIGAPCSGKTTIAASVFAELKESGQDAEFVTEKAREHIAQTRLLCQALDKPFSLTDEDQWLIFDEQAHAQIIFSSNPDTIVVCDSDPLLTLLYMQEIPPVLEAAALQVAPKMGILFYCPPLSSYQVTGNRVHDSEFAASIDAKIPAHYKKYAPNAKIYALPYGSVKEKVSYALGKIYEHSLGGE